MQWSNFGLLILVCKKLFYGRYTSIKSLKCVKMFKSMEYVTETPYQEYGTVNKGTLIIRMFWKLFCELWLMFHWNKWVCCLFRSANEIFLRKVWMVSNLVYYLLLAPALLPVLLFFSYLSWLGWQMFINNWSKVRSSLVTRETITTSSCQYGKVIQLWCLRTVCLLRGSTFNIKLIMKKFR